MEAYLNFKNVSYDSELFKSSSELNYDFSFILPPWEEIYTNDLERYESFEECERINQNLVKTYMENKFQKSIDRERLRNNRSQKLIRNYTHSRCQAPLGPWVPAGVQGAAAPWKKKVF